MKILAIYGSPRREGNTAQMMDAALNAFPSKAEIHRIYLADMNFSACGACRECKTAAECVVDDDMQALYNEMFWSDIILIGSPTQFSDVSADLKKMMERTWWMKGELKNKIGGYVVTGRRYIESTINTLQSFMLRHKMILGGNGAIGYTFTEMGTLDHDPLALNDARNTGLRLVELYELVHRTENK